MSSSPARLSPRTELSQLTGGWGRREFALPCRKPSVANSHITPGRILDRFQRALAGAGRRGRAGGRRGGSQPTQSAHHEPRYSLALASQPSRAALRGRWPVQYWYLFLAGGLTPPAVWPEPAITKRTGPPKNLQPSSTDFGGAIWSSRVARL